MKTASFTFHAALGFSEVEFTMDVKVASYVVYLQSTQVEGGPSA